MQETGGVIMKEGTIQFLQKVFDAYKTKIVVFQGDCHDCQKEVDVEIEMDDVDLENLESSPENNLNSDNSEEAEEININLAGDEELSSENPPDPLLQRGNFSEGN